MPIYVIHNKVTGEYMEYTSSMSARDEFIQSLPDPENWSRVPQMPNVRTDKLSTSFVDGVVPSSRGNQFKAEKEALSLEIESYSMKPEDRTEIKKEIKKVREGK